jgi:hypothetical protein
VVTSKHATAHIQQSTLQDAQERQLKDYWGPIAFDRAAKALLEKKVIGALCSLV